MLKEKTERYRQWGELTGDERYYALKYALAKKLVPGKNSAQDKDLVQIEFLMKDGKVVQARKRK